MTTRQWISKAIQASYPEPAHGEMYERASAYLDFVEALPETTDTNDLIEWPGSVAWPSF